MQSGAVPIKSVLSVESTLNVTVQPQNVQTVSINYTVACKVGLIMTQSSVLSYLNGAVITFDQVQQLILILIYYTNINLHIFFFNSLHHSALLK